jgi:15-cis-phytoene synthase
MNAEEALRTEGERPYFASGLFFDAHQRKDILRLYDFVQTAKNYARNQPVQTDELQDLITKWQHVGEAPIRELEVTDADDHNMVVAKNMARLKILYGFELAWVDAFLVSMLMDVAPKKFKTLKGSLAYVYGAAEVIGLMVASMLRLPKDARIGAEAQGRAMQWIMFIRDIAEDANAGRLYFPQEDLQQCGLKDLTEDTARAREAAFKDFIQLQLGRYRQWQIQASQDLPYVPRRPRVAINTAIHGHDYIAKQIARNPFVIYQQKVTPARTRLVFAALSHSFD